MTLCPVASVRISPSLLSSPNSCLQSGLYHHYPCRASNSNSKPASIFVMLQSAINCIPKNSILSPFLVWNAIIATFWNNSHTPWILYRSFLINYILLAQPDTHSLIFCPSDGSFKCDSNFQNIYFSKNYISCESYKEWFPVQWQHWDNYFEGIRPESPVSGHWKSLLLPWSNLVISCLRSCVSQKLWLSTAIEAWCVSI